MHNSDKATVMKNLSLFNYLHYVRLAGFPIGLGLVIVLVGGTLNRVMIAELGLPASLVGLFFAAPLLVAPVRAWLGYQSDTRPLWGLRREPYIILGTLVGGAGVIGAAFAPLSNLALPALVAGGTLLAFVAYGLGKNLASNTFEALLADKFEGEQRPRAVTFFKVAMFLGIMGGAIGLGKLLDPFSPARLMNIVLGVVVLVIILAVAAVIRQEPQVSVTYAKQAQEKPFWQTFKQVIWQDRQARLFFLFIMLVVIGTLAQDVLLEPYGALVLGMSVGETTRLTALWGGGTMVAMLAAGARLIKQFGYRSVLRVGLFLNIIVFGGLIASGALGSVGAFQGLVFVLGLGTGLSATAMLTAVIEFTTMAHAGLYMGVWGIAHELGQAFGSILAGGLVDLINNSPTSL